jgi:hypothetical protein
MPFDKKGVTVCVFPKRINSSHPQQDFIPHWYPAKEGQSKMKDYNHNP